MKTFSEFDMTLAVNYHKRQPVDGWLVSEKYDGCRAYWDGLRFWTRSGRTVDAPQWFTAGLPACHLDGELWAGRGGFAKASCACRLGGKHFTAAIRFAVFDAPLAGGTWPERMAFAAQAVADCESALAVPWQRISGTADLRQHFVTIKQAGGEGVVLRHPTATGYATGRCPALLRVKKIWQLD